MVEYVNQLYQLIISTVCMAKKVIRIINILTCKYFKAPMLFISLGNRAAPISKSKSKSYFARFHLVGRYIKDPFKVNEAAGGWRGYTPFWTSSWR